MKKRKTQSNESLYAKVFGQNLCENRTSQEAYQLLAFTAYFDAERNCLSREELLDKISELSPSPYNIFQDKDGYLLRYELDNPFDIEDEEHEKTLKESIVKFLEENGLAMGSLQEIEIGIWDSRLFLIEDTSEVIEWR